MNVFLRFRTWQGEVKRLFFIVLTTLLLSLSVTLFSWKKVSDAEYAKNTSYFNQLAESSEKALLHKMNSYEQALLGGRGLFAASKSVERNEWKAYVEAIHLNENFPGIMGIGFIEKVRNNEVETFLKITKEDGAPNFYIHPKRDESDYFIIKYIEPNFENKLAVGFNVSVEKNRREAAIVSMNSGKKSITKRIHLLQDKEKNLGFLLLLPIYKNGRNMSTLELKKQAFLGWIFAPFVAKNFMMNLTPEQGHLFEFDVYDGDIELDREKIYTSEYDKNSKHEWKHHSLFTIHRMLNINQQKWSLVWRSTPEFEQSLKNSNEPIFVLVAGLLFTGFLGIYLWMNGQKSLIIQKNVDERTFELKHATKRMQAILDTVVDGIITVDTHCIIQSFNRSAERIFGYRSEEVIGKYISVLMLDDSFAILLRSEYFNKYLEVSGNQLIDVENELEAKRKDGNIFPVDFGINAFEMDGNKIFVTSMRDTTDRKEMQSKIALSVDELERAREQAEYANRMKSDFLATMSHEIRTPMNGIIGMTELLLETELTAYQQDYAHIVMRSAESLLSIINDILDFSKIEAGKFDLEYIPFNLHVVLHETSELMSVKAREKAIELIIRFIPSTPYSLLGDPTRIRQLLINLIGNAIKFTEKGCIVVLIEEVSCEIKAKNHAMIKISIKDTGVGISEEGKRKLFQKFSQADSSTTRKYGGTGLGLAISRCLSEMMGGDMGFESEIGKGSLFWFTMQLECCNTEVSHLIAPSFLENMKGLRALVVDDVSVNITIVREQLEWIGMECLSCSDSTKVFDLLCEAQNEGRPIQIALLDYMMPHLNGEGLARQIKAVDSPVKDTPLVILTSAGGQGLSKHFSGTDVAAYLSKPIYSHQLLETVSRVWQDHLNGKNNRPPEEEMRSSIDTGNGACFEGARVLVAEDNMINQKLAIKVLTGLGVIVEMVSNGQEALDQVQSNHYDLIFMDCQMPIMDGFESSRAISMLKKEGKILDIPIIALTANTMKGDMERCLEAGMCAYLSKPMRKMDLINALTRWLPEHLIKPNSNVSV